MTLCAVTSAAALHTDAPKTIPIMPEAGPEVARMPRGAQVDEIAGPLGAEEISEDPGIPYA